MLHNIRLIDGEIGNDFINSLLSVRKKLSKTNRIALSSIEFNAYLCNFQPFYSISIEAFIQCAVYFSKI